MNPEICAKDIIHLNKKIELLNKLTKGTFKPLQGGNIAEKFVLQNDGMKMIATFEDLSKYVGYMLEGIKRYSATIIPHADWDEFEKQFIIKGG